jgi:hypothetical protein|tara:strand:+ start:587 stop:868 length:282 start_codon:yes stop_codon:yes gene_type:complete
MSKNKVKLYSSDNVIEEFYEAISQNNPNKAKRLHIPKSDVFYIRQAIYENTGNLYSLDHVERALYLEGHLDSKEVLDPHRPRGYCSYDTRNAR